MKQYPQILKKVFGEPWAIRREQLTIIQRLVEARVLGIGATAQDVIPAVADKEPEIDVDVEGGTAIIPVHGIIGKHLSGLEMMCGGCDIGLVSQMLDDANEDDGISRIILDFNTPGGTVAGVPELADKIAAMEKEVVAFTDSQCCSAGYWLASAAREFYCTGSSEVGSIGVWMAHFDYSRQMKNDGVEVTEIKAGTWKTMGAYWRPLTDSEKAILQAGVDKIHEQFKDAVTARRSIEDEDMQGQVFDGAEAVEHGLASGLVSDIAEILDA